MCSSLHRRSRYLWARKCPSPSVVGRHVAPCPALEGGAPVAALPGRPQGVPPACGSRAWPWATGAVRSARISAYAAGPTAKAMSANPGPARRRAQPDLAAGGLAHQFERRAGAQRSCTAVGGPIVPRHGRLARRSRTSISTRANFFAMRGASCRCWRQARVCQVFLFHFRHDRCFAPRPPQDTRAMAGRFHHCSMIRHGF